MKARETDETESAAAARGEPEVEKVAAARGEREVEAVVVVLVTGPDRSALESLGRRLVEERLAACANVIGGVASIFRWEGAVQDEAEALAILKTTRPRVPALRERVLALHPYEEPEFLALPVVAGSASYARWVADSVEEDGT